MLGRGQPHHRNASQPPAPGRERAIRVPRGRHLRRARLGRRAGERGARLRIPGLAGRLPGASLRDPPGRVGGRREGPRPGPRQGGHLSPRLHVRGLRRPARASAEGELLGKREPGGAARGLRRGQALRRGHHHGLPPLPRRRHPHRPHLQHLRAAHAARRRTGGADARGPGAARRAAHRLRRRVPDAELLLRGRQRRGHVAAAPLAGSRPGEHREPGRDDHPRVRSLRAEALRPRRAHRAQAPAAGRPQGRVARTSRGPGRSWAGSPRWASTRACGAASPGSASSSERGRTWTEESS